jgi:hypothetical protein
MRTRLVALGALALAIAYSPRPVRAQAAPRLATPPRTNVLSVQPLSGVFTLYAGEFEHAVSPTTSLGVGSTYLQLDGDGDVDKVSYLSGDVKVRYYPAGEALEGFSFGGSLGLTHVAARDTTAQEEATTGASIGTLLEYGWLLGETKRFYVGMGVGAKALLIGEKSFSHDVTLRYPTVRLSVGWAF